MLQYLQTVKKSRNPHSRTRIELNRNKYYDFVNMFGKVNNKYQFPQFIRNNYNKKFLYFTLNIPKYPKNAKTCAN